MPNPAASRFPGRIAPAGPRAKARHLGRGSFGRPVSVPSRGSARIGPDGGRSPDFPLPCALYTAPAPPTFAGLARGSSGTSSNRRGSSMSDDESGFIDTRHAAASRTAHWTATA